MGMLVSRDERRGRRVLDMCRGQVRLLFGGYVVDMEGRMAWLELVRLRWDLGGPDMDTCSSTALHYTATQAQIIGMRQHHELSPAVPGDPQCFRGHHRFDTSDQSAAPPRSHYRYQYRTR